MQIGQSKCTTIVVLGVAADRDASALKCEVCVREMLSSLRHDMLHFFVSVVWIVMKEYELLDLCSGSTTRCFQPCTVSPAHACLVLLRSVLSVIDQHISS